ATSGNAFPPALVIWSAAVKMVPGNLGCGLSVFAAITMLAPSRAARNAIARPMPRDAPVMNRVRSLSVMIPQSFRSASAKDEFSRERRVGVVDAVRRFDDGTLEALGPYGQVLGEEARDRDTPRRIDAIAAKPPPPNARPGQGARGGPRARTAADKVSPPPAPPRGHCAGCRGANGWRAPAPRLRPEAACRSTRKRGR